MEKEQLDKMFPGTHVKVKSNEFLNVTLCRRHPPVEVDWESYCAGNKRRNKPQPTSKKRLLKLKNNREWSSNESLPDLVDIGRLLATKPKKKDVSKSITKKYIKKYRSVPIAGKKRKNNDTSETSSKIKQRKSNANGGQLSVSNDKPKKKSVNNTKKTINGYETCHNKTTNIPTSTTNSETANTSGCGLVVTHKYSSNALKLNDSSDSEDSGNFWPPREETDLLMNVNGTKYLTISAQNDSNKSQLITGDEDMLNTSDQSEDKTQDKTDKSKVLEEGDAVFLSVRGQPHLPYIIYAIHRNKEAIKKLSLLTINTTNEKKPKIHVFNRLYRKSEIHRYRSVMIEKFQAEVAQSKHKQFFDECMSQFDEYRTYRWMHPSQPWFRILQAVFSVDSSLKYKSSIVTSHWMDMIRKEEAGEVPKKNGQFQPPDVSNFIKSNESDKSSENNSEAGSSISECSMAKKLLAKKKQKEVLDLFKEKTDVTYKRPEKNKKEKKEKQEVLPEGISQEELDAALESKKKRIEISNKLLEIFVQPETKQYLFDIYDGKIPSELHDFHHLENKSRAERIHMKFGFGPGLLESDSQTSKIADILVRMFRERSQEVYSAYPVNVWMHEGMVYAVMKYYNLSKEEAWELYQKGPELTDLETKIKKVGGDSFLTINSSDSEDEF